MRTVGRTASRTLAIGFAGMSLFSIAGCASTSASGAQYTGDGEGGYADGSYSAEADYQAPSGTETVTVELTISGDAVTAVTVTGDASDREAAQYQSRFESAISSAVVGKDLATLSVSRVAGASLTSNGFNDALDVIRSQAS